MRSRCHLGAPARHLVGAVLVAMAGFAGAACRQRVAVNHEAPTAAGPSSTSVVAAAAAPALASSASTVAGVASGAGGAPESPGEPSSVASGRQGGATPGAKACKIEVGALLSAEVFRGVRRSQAREASRARLDPQTRSRWDGRDHGLRYLICKFSVTMNGQAFTYEHEDEDLGSHFKAPDPATCSAAAMRQEAAKRVREFTHDCADPHAGAYWGFDLQPVGGP